MRHTSLVIKILYQCALNWNIYACAIIGLRIRIRFFWIRIRFFWTRIFFFWSGYSLFGSGYSYLDPDNLIWIRILPFRIRIKFRESGSNSMDMNLYLVSQCLELEYIRTFVRTITGVWIRIRSLFGMIRFNRSVCGSPEPYRSCISVPWIGIYAYVQSQGCGSGSGPFLVWSGSMDPYVDPLNHKDLMSVCLGLEDMRMCNHRGVDPDPVSFWYDPVQWIRMWIPWTIQILYECALDWI